MLLPPFSRDAVRYSFGPMIQKQLSELVTEWNHHRIRKISMSEAPGGLPEVLYISPTIPRYNTCTVVF